MLEYKPFEKAQGNQIRSKNKLIFLNFSLPAIITCGHSQYCKEICYAYLHERRYPFSSKGNSVKRKRYANLYSTFDFNSEKFIRFLENKEIEKGLSPKDILDDLNKYYTFPKEKLFVKNMQQEIKKLANTHSDSTLFIRIHSDGDFYSKDYFEKWYNIVSDKDIIENEKIHFMAYTKEIDILTHFRCILKSINIKFVYSIIDKKTSDCDIKKFTDLKNYVNTGSIKPRYFMNSYKVYNSRYCADIKEVPCKNQCFNSRGIKKCTYNECKKCADTFEKSDCANCLKCYSKTYSNDIGTLNLNYKKIYYQRKE
ncbi:GP88 family protein [Clostridium thermosuccinogenes]|uniref:GP88 family protein n=1 Tax=Clostridium thermosuccinogenes TaxID=84032 RepID=UPI000CCBE4D2|nr:hypothetical protein [Pseudoclostridium thermosuccinogenes]PNT92080.1 hypothetical protein CDQ83_00385 [Pseudoclostridium thermosuccinogenes]